MVSSSPSSADGTTAARRSGLARARAGVGVTGPGARGDGGGNKSSARRRLSPTTSRLTLAALVAPSIVLLLLVNAFPFFYGLMQSVRDGSLINAGSFVGLDNYTAVLTDPRFWSSALFSCFCGAACNA